MIKAVFFDMGGVAVNMVVPAINKKVKDIFRIREFDILSKNTHIGELLHLLEINAIGEKELWTRFAKNINQPLPETWPSIIGYALKHSRFRPKIKQLIFDLKNKGITVAALSNVSEPFAKHHYKFGHYKNFDYLFLSHEIGSRKPEKQIYLHALKTVGVKPEESIFIDDNIICIEGAKKIGMHTIHFRNTTQLRKEITKYIPL